MKRAHFIGIAGLGMSATAKLLKDLGWQVSGSDSDSYPPASDYLARQGISFATGYDPKNIPEKPDLIVIGKTSKLTSKDNEEVRAALRSAASVQSFPEVLAGLSAKTENIVVAGSYGKSTCAALLAWCLSQNGLDPSYFIGAVPVDMPETSRIGKGKLFILEGDEYPSSNTDPRSKFLWYRPDNLLLTAAEHDHVNVFPTLTEYLAPFRELLARVPEKGLVVACAEAPNVRSLLSEYPDAITYGLTDGLWHAEDISYGAETSFDLYRGETRVVSLRTPLLGAHSIENIVGVSALLLEKKLLSPAQLESTVSGFHGLLRRLDLKTRGSSVPVYEGFGSSYRKAKAAIAALRLHFPGRRLLVVFEPHSFSWRDRAALHWYDDVFKECDKVFLYEPYESAEQGAETHDQLSQAEILERVRASGVAVATVNAAEGKALVMQELAPEDVVLLMSSGNMGGLIKSIPEAVEEQFAR